MSEHQVFDCPICCVEKNRPYIGDEEYFIHSRSCWFSVLMISAGDRCVLAGSHSPRQIILTLSVQTRESVLRCHNPNGTRLVLKCKSSPHCLSLPMGNSKMNEPYSTLLSFSLYALVLLCVLAMLSLRMWPRFPDLDGFVSFSPFFFNRVI